MDEQEKYSFLALPCYVENLSRCWEKVLHLGEKYTYKKGEIFFLGRTKNEFAYISHGKTCCYIKEVPGKRDEIRFFINEGCLIKDTYVLGGIGDFYTYHKCITDVILYKFSRNIIEDKSFIERHYDLLMNCIYSISAKSISSQYFSSLLKQKSNSQKLAVCLYGFYLLNGKKLCCRPQLTQRQLGELLGISVLTVNRVIQSWKIKKIIKCYTKNKLELIDIEKIKALRMEE